MRTPPIQVALAAVTLSLLLDGLAVSARASEPAAKRVLLIAGPITGHPKDAHEYEKSVVLLRRLIETSPDLRGVRAETCFRGWPADPAALDAADAIVLISDGSDRREADHPLYASPDRLAQLEKQARRGCGLVEIHWTTFHPSRFDDRVTELFGGYFDYETGPPPRKWRSTIETKTWDVLLPSPDHPVCRGVRPFRVQEEYYFDLRFRDGDARVLPLVAVGPQTKLEKTVAWALERTDGGRSFGTTGGHFFENWRQDDFRRLVLNAIAWAARVEVPAAGIASSMEDPLRLLVVTGYNHPAHDWRATTAALVPVLEQDPRVRVEVTEEPEALAGVKVERHAAVVLNYCNWDRPGLSEAAKKGLLDYVAAGGGLSVIHFANGAFNKTLPRADSDWEEYRARLVRRVWMHGEGGSGHDAYGPFRVELTGVAHEITRGLAPFETEDELYFHQAGALSIEPLVTARSKVTGKDEPLAWAYDGGGGRVFQTVLGHSDVSVRKAGALIRRGTVWAARREGIGFDPPAELTEGALFREGSQWSPEASRKRSAGAARDASTGGSK